MKTEIRIHGKTVSEYVGFIFFPMDFKVYFNEEIFTIRSHVLFVKDNLLIFYAY